MNYSIQQTSNGFTKSPVISSLLKGGKSDGEKDVMIGDIDYTATTSTSFETLGLEWTESEETQQQSNLHEREGEHCNDDWDLNGHLSQEKSKTGFKKKVKNRLSTTSSKQANDIRKTPMAKKMKNRWGSGTKKPKSEKQSLENQVTTPSKKSASSKKKKDKSEKKMSNSAPAKSGKLKMKTPIKSVRKLFKNHEGEVEEEKVSKEEEVDMQIGLRLALPDKLDIMTGLRTPKVRTNDNEKSKDPWTLSPVAGKKLLIVQEPSKKVSLKSFRRGTKSSSKASKISPDTGPNFTVPSSELAPFKIEVAASTKMNEIALRTTEQEPSVHQVTIPSAVDLLVHARVCVLMENYDRHLESRAKAKKRWFNFNEFVGKTRSELEDTFLIATGKNPRIPIYVGEGLNPGPPPLPNTNMQKPFSSALAGEQDSFGYNSSNTSEWNSKEDVRSKTKTPKKKSRELEATKPHPSIIKSLLECADDILVENYFTETIGHDASTLVEDEERTSSVQVVIFSSQRLRQLIVCFRGSMQQHAKPINKNKACHIGGQECNLHSDNPFPVNTTFRDAYFESNLEKKVFECLDRLCTQNPFCDVIFTGHSFAGCLALIGATRCAEKHSMMTVSCNVFGIPKVGGTEFRSNAHSLPNLRVHRIEYGLDAFVDLPSKSSWEHVGHVITLSSSSPDIDPVNSTQGSAKNAIMVAYKFGKKNNAPTSKGKHIDLSRSKKGQTKTDHEMPSYLQALETFTHSGSPWVSSYAGEGNGIIVNEEERLMV